MESILSERKSPKKERKEKSLLLRLVVQCTGRRLCKGAWGRVRDAAAVLPPALASVRFSRISIDFYSDAAVANVTSIFNWMRCLA